jgi:hypothetical protein
MRAQTTLDYAIGMSIFLIAVVFVFAFAPSMIDPFSEGHEEETVAVNRVADSLSQGMLGDPAEPYVIDRECLFAFFISENNDDDGTFSGAYPMGGCNYEATDNLRARLGIQGRPAGTGMHVRIRLVRDLTTVDSDDPDDEMVDDGESDTLCVDESNPFGPDPRIVEANDPGSSRQCDPGGDENDILFEIGGTPPSDSGSVVVARRTVYVEGGFADGTADATLIVEVWE